MSIVGLWHPDPDDSKGLFGMVNVAPLNTIAHPIPLRWIKNNPLLGSMALLRQGRLSVSPVTREEWKILVHRSETEE